MWSAVSSRNRVGVESAEPSEIGEVRRRRVAYSPIKYTLHIGHHTDNLTLLQAQLSSVAVLTQAIRIGFAQYSDSTPPTPRMRDAHAADAPSLAATRVARCVRVLRGASVLPASASVRMSFGSRDYGAAGVRFPSDVADEHVGRATAKRSIDECGVAVGGGP